MNEISKIINICLFHKCNSCCNPVKIDARRPNSTNGYLFIDLKEMLVPVEHPDTVKLKTYQCVNFNSKTGLCNDYENRPDICKNTTCPAFHTTDPRKQSEIIEKIKSEKFLRIVLKKHFFTKEVSKV